MVIFGVKRMKIGTTIFLYIVLFGIMQGALAVTAFFMGFGSGGDHTRQEEILFVFFHC
jgi:hypothetical protein